MILVKRFTFVDKALADQAFAIRHRVFVDEQGVPADLEYHHEEAAHQYLLFLDETSVATARWRETDAGIKLERFAVLPERRNRGLGAFLLNEVLRDVTSGRGPIYLYAQVRAVPFYERHGFSKVGESFIEAGILHFEMRYR